MFEHYLPVRYKGITDDLPDLIARYMYRCQSRTAECRQFDVVESGNRNVLRHAQSALANFPHRADSHKVVHADDGPHSGVRREQRSGGTTPTLEAINIGRGMYLEIGITRG